MLVKLNTDEALKPINALLWYILLCGIFVILAGALFGFCAIFFITKPLTEMIRIFSGNVQHISERLATDSSAEFATIGDAYNRMIEHIQAVVARIVTIKDTIAVQQHHDATHIAEMIESSGALVQQIDAIKKMLDTMNSTISTSTVAQQQTGAYNAQIITAVHLIETTIATVIGYGNEISKVLSVQENSASSESKQNVQQALRTVTSITPLLAQADNSCKQIIHLFREIEIKQGAEQGNIESLLARIRDMGAAMSQLELELKAGIEVIHRVEKDQRLYSDATEQLAAVVKELQVKK
jgi:methyl-accepting chemotaxis protein